MSTLADAKQAIIDQLAIFAQSGSGEDIALTSKAYQLLDPALPVYAMSEQTLSDLEIARRAIINRITLDAPISSGEELANEAKAISLLIPPAALYEIDVKTFNTIVDRDGYSWTPEDLYSFVSVIQDDLGNYSLYWITEVDPLVVFEPVGVTINDLVVASNRVYSSAKIEDLVLGNIKILPTTWNALTNVPDISVETVVGHAYSVSVAGHTVLDNINDWLVGDLAVKTYTGWIKISSQSLGGSSTATYEAGEDLNSKVPVVLLNNKVYRADSSSLSQRNLFLGITLESAVLGADIRVAREDIVTEPSWNFTPLSTIYLNGTSLSETPPSSGLFISVGAATTTTTLLLDPSEPIEL